MKSSLATGFLGLVINSLPQTKFYNLLFGVSVVQISIKSFLILHINLWLLRSWQKISSWPRLQFIPQPIFTGEKTFGRTFSRSKSIIIFLGLSSKTSMLSQDPMNTEEETPLLKVQCQIFQVWSDSGELIHIPTKCAF